MIMHSIYDNRFLRLITILQYFVFLFLRARIKLGFFFHGWSVDSTFRVRQGVFIITGSEIDVVLCELSFLSDLARHSDHLAQYFDLLEQQFYHLSQEFSTSLSYGSLKNEDFLDQYFDHLTQHFDHQPF